MANLRLGDIPPLPAQMESRPFGYNEQGNPIKHVNGTIVRIALDYVREYVMRRVEKESPSEISSTERELCIKQAQDAVVHQLVIRLNQAIVDPHYYVSSEYLLRRGVLLS